MMWCMVRSVLLLALVGCTGEAVKESDSGGDACAVPLAIKRYSYDCESVGGACILSVVASAPMGGVTWTIVETGDHAYACGPKGGVGDCGVWEEVHDNFAVTGGVGDCGEVKSLTLEVVHNFQSQVDNESTLLDVEPITFLIEIADANGEPAGCAVDGDNPAHFAADCAGSP